MKQVGAVVTYAEILCLVVNILVCELVMKGYAGLVKKRCRQDAIAGS